ncbi:MAG: RlmE family RNA methyltransferase [Phycisphaerales bacterium]|nr:RlmE family RNA methyltransferase [Phycisphaerales bacterium]
MREVQDHWFRQAKADGYRSRAAYKLIEMDDRRKLLRKGDRVLDVGAAPGSWSQVASQRIGDRGEVIAFDLKEIAPQGLAANVKLLVADLRELTATQFGTRPFDVVLSDIGPDTSGDPSGDSLRSIALCNSLLDRAAAWLRKGGHMVMKVYEGAEYPVLLKRAASLFDDSKGFKPQASRAESVEIYLVCRGFRGGSVATEPARAARRGWATPESQGTPEES